MQKKFDFCRENVAVEKADTTNMKGIRIKKFLSKHFKLGN